LGLGYQEIITIPIVDEIEAMRFPARKPPRPLASQILWPKMRR